MNKKQVNEIHTKIINNILNSKLNIKAIPDDVEREIYEVILQTLEDTLLDQDCGCCLKYFR